MRLSVLLGEAAEGSVGRVAVAESQEEPIVTETLYILPGQWSAEARSSFAHRCNQRGAAYLVSDHPWERAMALSARLGEFYRGRYRQMMDVAMHFMDITLKDPNLDAVVRYFGEIMHNPVIIYDEFYHPVISADPRLEGYERDLATLERRELVNLFFYQQRVVFWDKTLPPCTRLLFPVLHQNMAKGYLAIFDVETPWKDMDPDLLSGASRAFGNTVSKKVKTRKQAQLVTYFSAFAFVFTEPTLTLGSIMRPVTEKLRISRVKLAYICDVMGCPFATLSPITSYSTYATSLIAAQFTVLAITGNAWISFVKAIPFNFYALFGMLSLFFVIIAGLDIGPMYTAEKRAVETGNLIGEKDSPMSKYDMDEDAIFSGKRITMANFGVPLAVLFTTLICMILWTGNALVNGIGGAFMNSNISLSISLGFLLAAVAAGFMGVRSGVFGLKDMVPNFCKGVALNTDVPIILVLAWSIGSLTTKMDLKGYLIYLVESNNIAPGLMPCLIFVVGAFVGFSTGSSWGVWAITMPITLPIAHTFGIPLELAIGACLSGGVFGDHCSPISDTTILASTAAGADHIQHVRTQLPYSITVGSCSAMGFLVGGLTNSSWLGFAVAGLSTAAAFFLLHKYSVKQYGNIQDHVPV